MGQFVQFIQVTADAIANRVAVGSDGDPVDQSGLPQATLPILPIMTNIASRRFLVEKRPHLCSNG
jgi:hypothetical protein